MIYYPSRKKSGNSESSQITLNHHFESDFPNTHRAENQPKYTDQKSFIKSESNFNFNF